MNGLTERRKQGRVDVRWPLRLIRRHGDIPVMTYTKNVSSHGFFCYSSEPFSPGEMLICTIDIPAWRPGGPDASLMLECSVQVIWVEQSEGAWPFGIGCQIHDYAVVTQMRERMRVSATP